MRKLLIISAALSLLLYGCGGSRQEVRMNDIPAQPETEKYVEVDADAEVVPVPENQLVTRRNGVDAAKKMAVEKAVGVYVTGQQMISKSLLISEKIFSKTTGYIKDYTVTSEGMNGLFWKTGIHAKIRMGDIKTDIDALDLLIKTTAGNPRVMVVIGEVVDGVAQNTGSAETLISGTLLDAGYKLVDQSQLEEINGEDALKAAAAGDEKAAAKIGKRFGADVAVIGKITVSTRAMDIEPYKGWISGIAELNIKVVKTTNGDVLMVYSKTGNVPDISKEGAAASISKRLSSGASKELAASIGPKLVESNFIKLIVSPLPDLNALEKTKKWLKTFESLTDVVVRSYDEGTAEFEVELAYGSALDFAAKLQTGKGVKVTEAGGHSITAVLEK